MAKLLIEEQIATEDSILISSVNENLQNLINKVKNSEILLFSHKGRLIKTYRDLFSEKSNKNYVAVIGGLFIIKVIIFFVK